MVSFARKTLRTGEFRALNLPQPVQVEADAQGAPLSVCRARRGRTAQPVPVRHIQDRWRVDDLWWRKPVCRMYWQVELEDDRVEVLFHDRIADRWYRQSYG